ncbi:hypothetical protein CYMTET_9139 [Cymbomonas tetramitiformis]|uniref:Uncharacterized protein n=1 Tax=Cymbomonas tetramitiformis TaxID=36881 RepID=A0AAE0GS18_9CHLO|nr:hypothetical protein CYMTET_9139 [Cymbomonas tetramitiformis]
MATAEILSEEELLSLLDSFDEKLVPQAPPVRTEHHYYSAVDPPPAFLASGQREETHFSSGDSEDESEYPVGYYDESSDDEDEGYGVQYSDVRPCVSEQEPPVDTGFYGEPYGGVLEPHLGMTFYRKQTFLLQIIPLFTTLESYILKRS